MVPDAGARRRHARSTSPRRSSSGPARNPAECRLADGPRGRGAGERQHDGRPEGEQHGRRRRQVVQAGDGEGFLRPPSRSFCRLRRRPPGEQHGGHRGREVQARDAVAHRDPDRRSARAVSSSLSPWRSVPKASTERGRQARGLQRIAARIERQQRPVCRARAPAGCSQPRRPAARSAGRRRPAARPDATGRGCPWSAHRRRRRRRPPARRRPCCRGRGGPRAGSRAPGGGLASSCGRSMRGRSAIAITEVLGASGESCSNTARLEHRWAERQPRARDRERARRPARSQFVGVAGDEQLEQLAPNLSACLTGWKPSSTASAGSRRARPKRGIS